MKIANLRMPLDNASRSGDHSVIAAIHPEAGCLKPIQDLQVATIHHVGPALQEHSMAVEHGR